MKRARITHGTHGGSSHCVVLGHPRAYDLLAWIFFGGRRRRVFERLASLSGARSGDHVVDVGCGTGYFTRIMAETVAPSGSAVGVDASRDMIAYARRITRLSNCSFSEGTAEALDVADGSQDVVVTSLMIHHLPETMRAHAIREMYRVLRPGGRVLIAEFRSPTTRIGRLLAAPHMSPAMRNNPVHRLVPMVREAGFEQLRSGDVRPWIRYVQAVKPDQGR
jgi:ubiquinone/menaquinone biosynthesis C-methylase UbiE